MGFFDKLFSGKSKEEELGAPVDGEAVPLSEVSDPTFGEEILGKGVAIRPTGNQIYSPCDASVDLMFDTGHAVSLKGDNGAEILIHVGLETVSLKGKHFKVFAKTDEHVSKGQLLIEFDREAIAAEGYDTITPMVICNTADYQAVNAYTGKTVAAGDTVLGLVK